MKTKTIAFLTALLLIVLAGCNNAPPNEDKPQPFSFSESVQSTSESEAPAGKESKEVETTPEAVQEVKPEKQEETTETDTVSTEQPQTVSETGQAAQPAEQPDKADKTEHSVSTPQPDIPKESETPAPPETEETPSETKTDFDIDYWISFAKGYAQSVGLLLDSEAVYCWIIRSVPERIANILKEIFTAAWIGTRLTKKLQPYGFGRRKSLTESTTSISATLKFNIPF